MQETKINYANSITKKFRRNYKITRGSKTNSSKAYND